MNFFGAATSFIKKSLLNNAGIKTGCRLPEQASASGLFYSVSEQQYKNAFPRFPHRFSSPMLVSRNST